MNKQEILEEITKIKEHLEYLKEKLKREEYKRYNPKDEDVFYYIFEIGTVIQVLAWAECVTKGFYNFYNCFKTRKEAEQEAEKILVRRMLEDIARRLNKDEELDWTEPTQEKYYLNYRDSEIATDFNTYTAIQGVVYCLDRDFRDVAIQEIGKERLTKYLRGE